MKGKKLPNKNLLIVTIINFVKYINNGIKQRTKIFVVICIIFNLYKKEN